MAEAPANSIVGTFVRPVDIGTVAKLVTNSYSLFGQLEYDFTSKLTGIVGLRAIQSRRASTPASACFPRTATSASTREIFYRVRSGGLALLCLGSFFEHLWAGKLQLDYHLTDQFLLYAGVNRGVKAGSFNAPLLGAYLGSGWTSLCHTRRRPCTPTKRVSSQHYWTVMRV